MPAFASSNCSGPKRFPKSRSFTALMPVKWLISKELLCPEDPRIRIFDNDDLFAPPASGSADYDAMAVVPCSVGTLGRIACGVSQSLIERAADVMLKERRRLVLVVRETPLSLIHLRNMTALTEAGAVVLPASPGFYARPSSVEELCRSVAERVTALLGISGPRYRWTGEGRSAGRNDSDSEK